MLVDNVSMTDVNFENIIFLICEMSFIAGLLPVGFKNDHAPIAVVLS